MEALSDSGLRCSQDVFTKGLVNLLSTVVPRICRISSHLKNRREELDSEGRRRRGIPVDPNIVNKSVIPLPSFLEGDAAQ